MNPVLTPFDFPQWLPDLLNWLIAQLNVLMHKLHLAWTLPSVGWEQMPGLLLLIWSVVVFTLLAILGQAAAIIMVLMERKVLAWLTQRKGPNRVGPWGALQTLADGVKLLFKEDIIPAGASPFLFTIAPAVFFIPCFVFYALVPFSDQLLAIALPAGALFVFAISSISVVGLVLSGWASNNKYSLLGGMRSAAQAISYEIPLVLAVLGVVLFADTMNIQHIVEAQRGPIWNWYFLLLTPISFAIFFISALAEVNRIPFDLPEAESELVSGYNTEYTGMKFALFFLAEYASLFAMSALIVAFFFGGYFSPIFGYYMLELPQVLEAIQSGGASWAQFLAGTIPVVHPEGGTPLFLALQVEQLFWFLMKTFVFIFLAMWVRATLPRLKPDQLMGFSWKFLIPLSLINIFVIALGKYAFIWQVNTLGAEHFSNKLPVLQNGPLALTWAVWAGVTLLLFWLFFSWMSRLFTGKLQARLAQR